MRDQHTPTGVDSRFNEGELVFMLGEELKKPLTVIKALSETDSSQRSIALHAQKALRTIDNVLLTRQINENQIQLDLTAVHVGSVLANVSEQLTPLSIEHGCETEVYIQSNISSVTADRAILVSGFESIWHTMIGLTNRPSTLRWSVYRSGKVIRVALTNNSVDLSKVTLGDSGSVAGSSTQPISGLAGPATDLSIAQQLFRSLNTQITKVHREGMSGLAVSFEPSTQLSLV